MYNARVREASQNSFAIDLTDYTLLPTAQPNVNLCKPTMNRDEGKHDPGFAVSELRRSFGRQHKEWQHLVPTEIVSYLEEIDAVKRLQLLSEEKNSC